MRFQADFNSNSGIFEKLNCYNRFLTVGGNVFISRQSRKGNSTVALQQMENAKSIASLPMEQLRIKQ